MEDKEWRLPPVTMRLQRCSLICEADEVYATNRLLELFDVMEYEENPEITESRAVCEILEDMMTYAHENGIMKEDTITAKDLFDTKIMGCITPPPSVVRVDLHPMPHTYRFYLYPERPYRKR